MHKLIPIGVAAGLAALATSLIGYGIGSNTVGPARGEASASGDTLDRVSVEQIVHEYLVEHPEILIEVQTALETKQREQQRLAQLNVISESSSEIFDAAFDGIVGNADGAVTIVEFFDYNCGYCKRALADMDAMVSADPDLRFVMKEFPILGPDSQQAHIVSMAFRQLMPDRYEEFHRRLLSGAGRADEGTAIDLALELGAEEAALRQKMADPAIIQAFESTYQLANKLSITGTPSYIVGDEVVFGALGQEHLAEKVANIRNCQSATC